MRTPVPSEPRRFKLTDDTCFSGIRKPPEYRHTGGGYYDPRAPTCSGTTEEPFAEGELAAMVMITGGPILDKGQVRLRPDSDVSKAEREAVAEWVHRTTNAKPADPA